MPLDFTDEERLEFEHLKYNHAWEQSYAVPEKGDYESELRCAWDNLTHYKRQVVYRHRVAEIDHFTHVHHFYTKLYQRLLGGRSLHCWIFNASTSEVTAYVQEIEEDLSSWEEKHYASRVRYLVESDVLPILEEAVEKSAAPYQDMMSWYFSNRWPVLLAFAAASLFLLALAFYCRAHSWYMLGRILAVFWAAGTLGIPFWFRADCLSKVKKLRIRHRKRHFAPKLDRLEGCLKDYCRQTEEAPLQVLERHVGWVFQCLSLYPKATKEVLADERERCQQRVEEKHGSPLKHDKVRDTLLSHKRLSEQLPEWFDVPCMRLLLDFVCVPEYLDGHHGRRLTELLESGLRKTASRHDTKKCYEKARRFVVPHYSPDEFEHDLDGVSFHRDLASFTAAQEKIRAHIAALEPSIDDQEVAISEAHQAYQEFKDSVRQRWQHIQSNLADYRSQMSGKIPSEEVDEECGFQLREFQKQNAQDLESYKAQWGEPPDDPELDRLLAGEGA